MRNLPFWRTTPPLKPSRAIDDITRFVGLEYAPRNYRSDHLGGTGVFVQTMNFVGLHDGSIRAAPPILIGTIVRHPDARAFISMVARKRRNRPSRSRPARR